MCGDARSLAVSIDPGKIELDAFGEILGIDRELAVIARRQGDPGRKADRGGHDESVIVVGVLADQVDAPGGAINARVTAIQPPEFPLQISRSVHRATPPLLYSSQFTCRLTRLARILTRAYSSRDGAVDSRPNPRIRMYSYPPKSIFRRGLDILCRLVINFERFDVAVWRKVIKLLSCS